MCAGARVFSLLGPKSKCVFHQQGEKRTLWLLLAPNFIGHIKILCADWSCRGGVDGGGGGIWVCVKYISHFLYHFIHIVFIIILLHFILTTSNGQGKTAANVFITFSHWKRDENVWACVRVCACGSLYSCSRPVCLYIRFLFKGASFVSDGLSNRSQSDCLVLSPWKQCWNLLQDVWSRDSSRSFQIIALLLCCFC